MTMAPPRVRVGIGALSGQTLHGQAAETHRALDELMRVCVAAEAAGLHSVWVSEHHFSEDGYLPSPLPVLAAVARETDRVTLSTNVMIGPLHDPIRLAEDAAVVDQLSSGRLMVGLGLGYREEEFAAFGRSRRRRAAMIEDLVPRLRRAWAGDLIDTPGGDVRVTPPPYRDGGPPVLLGAFVEQGVRRARRLADGWIAPEFDHPRQLEKRLDMLDLAALSGTRTFHVVVTMSAFVAPSDAWETVRPGAQRVGRRYRRWLRASGDLPALDDRSFDDDLGHEGRPTSFVAGTVDECVAQLRPWWQLLGSLPVPVVPHVTFRTTFPGVPRAATLRSVRLLGAEVVPALEAP